MEINKAKFTSSNTIEAEVNGVVMYIPVDTSNMHYREILEQGIVPTPVNQKTPEEQLEEERSAMTVSRLQGRLTLGETTCNALDQIANNPETPWAMRQTILHAIEWKRTSQAMTELGYLLGYGPDQMDALFRAAAAVEV